MNDDPRILSQIYACITRNSWYGWHNNIERYRDEENDKVLVISISQTIVDIDAVMIKFLYAALACHAMEGFSRFYNFAVETKVLKVNVFIISDLK